MDAKKMEYIGLAAQKCDLVLAAHRMGGQKRAAALARAKSYRTRMAELLNRIEAQKEPPAPEPAAEDRNNTQA